MVRVGSMACAWRALVVTSRGTIGGGTPSLTATELVVSLLELSGRCSVLTSTEGIVLVSFEVLEYRFGGGADVDDVGRVCVGSTKAQETSRFAFGWCVVRWQGFRVAQSRGLE